MHIGINCRSFLTQNYTGIGRYTFNLVTSLAEIDKKNRYSLYCSKGFFSRKRRIPQIKADNFSIKNDWLNHGLERTLKSVDIYHSPSPDVFKINRAKVIVTVHDLVYKAYPEGHTEETIRLTDQQFSSFIPQAAKIICVSQNTKADLKTYFQLDESKICIVHQGVDNTVFYPLNTEEKLKAKEVIRMNGIEDPYILFVGTIEPRKNLKNLLKAFMHLKLKKIFKGKLVIIGMMGWKSEGIDQYIEDLGIRDNVAILGFLNNDELRYFYNLAEVFVFPSFYEGFGYPLVEAFSCGCCVVSSNSSSCPEITGDAAIKIAPGDPQEIVRAIERVLKDSKLRKELRDKALIRAKEFSFRKTAEETLEVYKDVYNSR